MKNVKHFLSSWQDVTSGERNQVVFEHLNKTYGAYEIRTNYDRTLIKSLSAVVITSILISGYFIVSAFLNPVIEIPETPAMQFEYPTTPPPNVVPPVCPPTQPPGGPAKGNELSTPVVTTDSVLTNDSTTFLAITPGNPNGNPVDSGNINTGVNPNTTKSTLPVDSVHEGVFVDEPPTFPGGDKALFGFLLKNISYPETVKEIGGTGMVAVSFVLDKEGNVTEVTPAKGSRYAELNKEALRVISKLPKWNPAKQNGHPVKVRMILPIRFELKQ